MKLEFDTYSEWHDMYHAAREAHRTYRNLGWQLSKGEALDTGHTVESCEEQRLCFNALVYKLSALEPEHLRPEEFGDLSD